MAIKDFNELYWKLFNIAEGGTDSDITKVLDSIVKSDKAKLSQYFTNAIDQIAFDTQDWKRIKELFLNMFSAHRALITQQKSISDPHFLSNDDLDELFRSFGYNHSVSLKNFDNNPLENKVQLFLDLVNLYKIKGTPRSILEALQYYGLPDLDIFEFWLQKQDANNLTFKGEVVAGTSQSSSVVYLPYDVLTATDPHWMLTESQILNLNNLNKINLPSKSPYFAVQPIVEIGIENAILVRTVQDQYFAWKSSGVLPTQNADVSILGTSCSLLELYLLTLVSFQKDYDVGSEISLFSCYDGTSIIATDIIAEYEELIAPPITRASKITKWESYVDLFTRERSQHFLYGSNTAESVLNQINSSLLSDINSLGADNSIILQSLLKDIALWVRNNVGYGFVNTGYIFFGLNQLFEDLKPVINFFKPYRARLIVLEMLRFNNLLSESIPVEDAFYGFDVDTILHDKLIQPTYCPTDSTDSYCSEFISEESPYDCGMYYDSNGIIDDYRACDGKGLEITIDQSFCIPMRCPPGFASDSTSVTTRDYDLYCERIGNAALQPTYTYDSTTGCIIDSTNAYVFSEEVTNITEHIENLAIGSTSLQVFFKEPLDNDDYILNVNLFNQTDGYLSSMYGIIITEKTKEYFTVTFSSPIDSINYKIGWNINTSSTESGTDNLTINQKLYRVDFDNPLTSSNYSISTTLINEVDSPTSIYSFIVTNKDINGFDIELSGYIDSSNYYLDWNVYDSTSVTISGVVDILPDDTEWLEVNIDTQEDDQYSLAVTLENITDASTSVYAFIVTQKDTESFLIRFSSPIDSTNYTLCWAITYITVESQIYRQESGFREFDSYGTFDCTHGFDMVEIVMENTS